MIKMDKKTNVLILLPADDAHKKLFEQAAPQADIVYTDSKSAGLREIERADIIIGNPNPALLSGAKNLRWLQLASAGANLYVGEGILPKNVLLTNATGCYGMVISEYMIATVLSLFLHLQQYAENQREHRWHGEGRIKSIYGSTALIVGLGDIGGEFAKRFKAMGGHTIGVRRSDRQKPDFIDELYLTDRLDELLPRADVVALSLPETPQTHKLFSRERLALMKSDAILLNVGRGMAIDTDALCEALNSGRLGGAVLDVTDPEPLPPEHPLWEARNILITPHVSGNYNLPETYERVAALCADNLKRYMDGLELNNLVDLSTGYKKHD
jgi:phosphoglycerate dehydrogenase-like enzyme